MQEIVIDDHEPTDHDIDSFRRLLMHLPMEADQELIILKGHLLIEEQLRAIIAERIPDPSSLELSNINWQFYHIARLAESLCFGEEEDVVWRCIQKLSKIRNDLAHNLDPKGLTDRVDDLIQTWPSEF